MKLWILFVLMLSSLRYFAQDTASSKEISTALYMLNKIRKVAGLDTVTISSTLSKGCYNHAKYLVINKNSPRTAGMNAHEEDMRLEGCTVDGKFAGKHSVIHYVAPTEAIEGWVKTFYHRIPLLQPELKEIGISFFEKDGYIVSLIDCISGLKGESSKDVVFYPAENQKEIPTTMGPEIPHPIGKEGTYGFPITIYFAKRQKITNVSFTLTSIGGKAIDCYLSVPEKPATYFDQWNSICAIPKKSLTANTKYFVTVNCIANGKTFKKTYNFKTIEK
jgi:hypothetical protein